MDTLTGDGVEMMPFHNIFNEWYAAQTSKKIRAVWQSKAEHGERIASIVPYGYKKSEDNPKQWVIDEPAAQAVRLVLEAVSDLSDFVRCYEPVFLYLLAKKNNAMRQKEYQQL